MTSSGTRELRSTATAPNLSEPTAATSLGGPRSVLATHSSGALLLVSPEVHVSISHMRSADYWARQSQNDFITINVREIRLLSSACDKVAHDADADQAVHHLQAVPMCTSGCRQGWLCICLVQKRHLQDSAVPGFEIRACENDILKCSGA